MTGRVRRKVAQEVDQQNGWSIETYAAHNEALRRAQERFENERDRRYTEIAIEREKALSIKETADLAALGLAREIQTYKDEKANDLRSQIERERGTYATQSDLTAAVEKLEETLKPILGFISAQQGRSAGGQENRSLLFSVLGLVVGAAIFILGRLIPV